MASFERRRHVCFTLDFGRVTATQQTDALGQQQTQDCGDAVSGSAVSGICRKKTMKATRSAVPRARNVVNERRNWTIDFRPKGTPMLRLAGAVALAPAQLVGIAQPGRTRER